MTTTTPRHPRRWLSAATAALTLAGLAVAPPSAAAAAAPPNAVTLTPDPSYQGPAFQGWGTSLVWFANATGGYPDALRDKLADMLFSDEGLNLNIARYNVGGGNATDVPNTYFRAGGAVQGWWNPALPASDAQGPITSTYADRDRYLAAWTGEEASDYDLTADATQRWWVERIKQDVTHWEAFSNSPPYFMTESGYVTGGFDSNAEQIKPAAAQKFARYMTTVAEHVEDTAGISFDSINPLNEPNTNYWGTRRNADGTLQCCRQEGAHVGPARQALLLEALADELARPDTTTDAIVSGPDETNPSIFGTDWSGWTDRARAEVGRLNVHTYGTADRTWARDIAKTADKPLWMSEVEGNWGGSGFNPDSIENGLGLAGRITDDLRELEPSAWVFWQPVEDFYNMQRVEKLNWGSIFIDFDCDADGNSARRVAAGEADPSCKLVTNTKYDTTRNFTHFIGEGDHIVPTNDTHTTSAVKADGSGAVLVHANNSDGAAAVTVDLSGFADIAPGATVTPVVTTASPAATPSSNALVTGTPVAVDAGSRRAVLTVPAKSVTTFLVSGVSGVAAQARALTDGASYQIVGVQSGKALTAGATGTPATTITTPATTPAAAKAQQWTVTSLTGGDTNAERYVLRTADGLVLTGQTSGTALRQMSVQEAGDDPSAQWIPSTTDGTVYSFTNVARAQALEVGGQSTAENAGVGLYRSNNGANQQFRVRSTAPTGIVPVSVATLPGVAPTLPGTVTPTYSWGAGAPVPVTWNTADLTWGAGTRTVTGTATDVFGTVLTAVVATVDVGTFTVTDPVSVTTYAGVQQRQLVASAPQTVPARIGAGTTTHPTPVQWDFSTLTDADLAQPGVWTVRGTAASNDPAAPRLDAVLTVIVTAGTTANIAPEATTTASATFTEPGYSVDRTRNGVTDDKGWSNWVSGTKRAADTLTYLFPERRITTVDALFFRDGGANSWPATMRVEYRVPGSGQWVAGPSGTVATTAPAAPGQPTAADDLGGVAATGVRVVLTAQPQSHMIVSEVRINAVTAAPAAVADAAALRIGGVPVTGFAPGTTEYTVPADLAALPVVTAVAADANATVSVTQAVAGAAPTATVTITAQDGTTVRTYRVRFVAPAVDERAQVALTAGGPANAAGWYTTPVIVALSAPAGGGTVQYRLGDGTWRTATRAFTLSTAGETVVTHRVLRANRVVAGSETTFSVKIDRVAPVATVTADPATRVGSPRNPVTLTFAATDATSGSPTTEYRVNGGDWTTGSSLRLTAVGEYSVQYRATDLAGNVSIARSVTASVRPDVATTVKSSTARPTAGSIVTFSLAGFPRYSAVRLTAGETVLGTVTSDVNGAARFTVPLPAALVPGAHLITAASGTTSATTTLTVVR